MTAPIHARVSVIIPARNEEENIERAVRSVAQQKYVAEIVVVDDQSEDRTGEILERLKGEIRSLRVIRADALPAGWTGKAHALATGTRDAASDWLLLTDADSEHLAGSLEVLLARAENENVDLLSLSPGQLTPSSWEKAVIPLIFAHLSRRFPFDAVNDPGSPVAAANGQYILIRRTMYERVGGHAAVCGEILEDVALARRVKAAHGKLLFLPGAAWVETRMYGAFGEMWRGWTKNLFLLFGGEASTVLARATALWFFDLLPTVLFVGLCIALVAGRGGTAAVLGAVGCFLIALVRQWKYGQALERIGFDPNLASYQIPGAALLGILLLNSARAHCWRGRVNWKGREYSTKGAG